MSLILNRRALIGGAMATPLAALLADPYHARAQAATLEQVSTTTPDGRTVQASLALPDARSAPGVLLIHEWWGLNDQIKTVAAEFARLGYAALAIDLYDGQAATDPETAKKLIDSVKPEAAKQTLAAWIGWLRAHGATTEKLGAVGWCFGGGWSLRGSLAAPVDASVIYYGNVALPAAELAALKGPVLGHFANKDNYINRPMVEAFEAEMKIAEKPLVTHWYEAEHGFANPTSARYDQADAALAWERTTAFFKQNLY